MSSFALVLPDGKVHDVQPTSSPIVSPWVWVDVSAVTPAPQVGWSAVETGGVWAFTPPAAPAGPTIEVQAQAALDVMDAPGGCAIRCFKAGVAFPANWQAYTTELRSIRNGTASPMPTTLPTAPAFPAGT
jgi:hypothetical protein